MPTPRSEAERFAQLSPDRREAELAGKSERWFAEREHDWNFWGRYEQQAPAGNWPLWLMMAGRGFGKTRTGAEWVRACAAADGSLRIALVAATLNEARTIMVEGESGLLNIGSSDERPSFEPSLRRLTWPSGAVATLYSAGEPESLRGPEHHLAWADEVAKWNAGEAAWDNLALTMRLGERPRIDATTTPRPVPLIRRLMRMIEAETLAMAELRPGTTTAGIMAIGVGDAVPVRCDLEFSGLALLPPSPVHLRAERQVNGDTAISWIRRSRAGWGWGDGMDAPLAEEFERYSMVFAPNAGPARVIECNAATMLYEQGDRLLDLAAGATAMDVSIRQYGTHGQSRAARMTFSLL